MATVNSDYFANYRFGDSFIPAENSLIRYGPYEMSTVRTRNSILVKFKSNYGLSSHYENLSNFFDYDVVSKIIDKNKFNSLTYLWLCKCKTNRKI